MFLFPVFILFALIGYLIISTHIAYIVHDLGALRVVQKYK